MHTSKCDLRRPGESSMYVLFCVALHTAMLRFVRAHERCGALTGGVAASPQALLISEELANKPFLVLGNKIDLPNAASEDTLRYSLGLTETTGKEQTERRGDDRPVEVFMCSVVRKMGYADGEWHSFGMWEKRARVRLM